MDRKNIIIKITSLVIALIIIALFVMPVIVQASSLTDSAEKIVLKTVEDIEKYIDESKYPGYKEKLIALKQANHNWKFTLYYTGLDWKTVIYNEQNNILLLKKKCDELDIKTKNYIIMF